MSDEVLKAMIQQVKRPLARPGLKEQIEARAFQHSQEQLWTFSLPNMFKDWRWITSEALALSLCAVIGFYLGFSSEDQRIEDQIITAYEIDDLGEEDWTL